MQMICYIFHAENQYMKGKQTYQFWMCICTLVVTCDSFKVHFQPKMTCYWFCLDAYIPLRKTYLNCTLAKKILLKFLMGCSTTIDKIFYNCLAIVSEMTINI